MAKYFQIIWLKSLAVAYIFQQILATASLQFVIQHGFSYLFASGFRKMHTNKSMLGVLV